MLNIFFSFLKIKYYLIFLIFRIALDTIITINKPANIPKTTTSPKGWGLLGGGLTGQHGLSAAISTGEAAAGSLKLTTYRRAGTDNITNYTLKIAVPVGAVEHVGVDEVGYGWRKVGNEKTAEKLLLNNTRLMEHAIEQNNPTGLMKIIEVVVEAILNSR